MAKMFSHNFGFMLRNMSGKVATPSIKDDVEQQLLPTDIFESTHLSNLPPVVLKKLLEKQFGSSVLVFNQFWSMRDMPFQGP